jgi:hypothetical protein
MAAKIRKVERYSPVDRMSSGGTMNLLQAPRSRCPVIRTYQVLRDRGFTLIELLIVIAIIAVLISILLPSMARAKGLGKQTRELAAASQMMTAFSMYTDDSKGQVLPGYPTRDTVNGPVRVLNSSGERLFNEDAQRYPWRLAYYLNYDFRGLYQSDQVLGDLREKESEYAQYGVTYDYVISLYPSLGMNVAFVGGSDRLQEFDRLFQRQYGRVYIQRFDQAVRPSGVMAFASARAEEQPSVPILGRPEGFFRLDPPRFGATAGSLWASAYDANAATPGLNSGFISLRHAGKAVAAHLDSHAEMLGWDQLKDMRRWADQATSADWTIASR